METRLFKKGIAIALIGMAALTACNNSTKKQATQPEPSAPAQQTLSLKGTLVIGHEVRSFTAEGDSIEYWIVDKSGKLEKQYDELTKGGVSHGRKGENTPDRAGDGLCQRAFRQRRRYFVTSTIWYVAR